MDEPTAPQVSQESPEAPRAPAELMAAPPGVRVMVYSFDLIQGRLQSVGIVEPFPAFDEVQYQGDNAQ